MFYSVNQQSVVHFRGPIVMSRYINSQIETSLNLMDLVSNYIYLSLIVGHRCIKMGNLLNALLPLFIYTNVSFFLSLFLSCIFCLHASIFIFLYFIVISTHIYVYNVVLILTCITIKIFAITPKSHTDSARYIKRR